MPQSGHSKRTSAGACVVCSFLASESSGDDGMRVLW